MIRFASMPNATIKDVEAEISEKLAVLIGDNGAGKTRLLKSILNGQVKVWIDGKEQSRQDVGSIGPGVVLTDPKNQRVPRLPRIDQSVISSMEALKADLKQDFERWCTSNGVRDPETDQIDNFFLSSVERGKVWPRLCKEVGAFGAEKRLENDVSFVRQILSRSSEEGVKLLRVQTVTEGDFFRAPISQRFAKYHESEAAHILKTARANSGEASLYSEDDQNAFRDVYGPPPWEILNDVFKSIEFDFEILGPERGDFDEHEMKLMFKDKRSDTIVPEASLSSGERVVLLLSSILMFEQDPSLVPRRGRLVLLDEPDIYLHPRFIDTMMRLLVKSLELDLVGGIVMTSHSPIVAALAPEGSILLLERKGKETLTPISKSDAVNRLTNGLPHFHVGFETQRNVITESHHDADFFTAVYRVCKKQEALGKGLPRTPEQRVCSLNFIGSGTTGGGKSRVKDLVGQLTENGNRDVFGLIDRDEDEEPTDRILLAGGHRYTLENYIFDPVLILALIVKLRKTGKDQYGLSDEDGVSQLDDFRPEQLQQAVDKVQAVFLDLDGTIPQNTKYSYLNGKSVMVSKQWADMNKKMVCEKISDFLDRATCRVGKDWAKEVIDLLRDFPGFIPLDIAETLRDLETRPV